MFFSKIMLQLLGDFRPWTPLGWGLLGLLSRTPFCAVRFSDCFRPWPILYQRQRFI